MLCARKGCFQKIWTSTNATYITDMRTCGEHTETCGEHNLCWHTDMRCAAAAALLALGCYANAMQVHVYVYWRARLCACSRQMRPMRREGQEKGREHARCVLGRHKGGIVGAGEHSILKASLPCMAAVRAITCSMTHTQSRATQT
jgi:hypothetical protein